MILEGLLLAKKVMWDSCWGWLDQSLCVCVCVWQSYCWVQKQIPEKQFSTVTARLAAVVSTLHRL